MIHLGFTIDADDNAETQEFIEEVLLGKKLTKSIEGPRGFIAFTINGGENLSWCGYSDKEELLPFAVGMNTILHTIEVGEEVRQFQMTDGGRLIYKLLDSQTVLISCSPSKNVNIPCDFIELKSKSQSFCNKLYSTILSLYPRFFEALDYRFSGWRNQYGETRSEEVIRMLLQR
jgi:hypothetical protein